MPRVPTLSACCAAVLLLATIRPAAADDVVEMSFEGFGPAGIHVMTTRTVIEQTPTWYAIRGSLSTAGLGALFVSLASNSMTQGRQTADVPHPVSFESDTARNGVMQRLHVDYRPDGPPSGSVTPPPSEPVTPVEAAELPGTVDGLTAYLMLQRRLARGGDCRLGVPVFDGRHRYDLDFSDAGQSVLKPADGQNFSGPARACRMARRELGGFYVDKTRTEGARSGTIWYAPLIPGDIAVPVRMQMDTEIGPVSIYLSQLRGRGIDRRFME